MKAAKTLLSVNRPLDDESGVTLVELLVVCVIIAIVAGLALMQRGSANEQLQRQNAAQGLKVAFERARFDSVKRRAGGGSEAAQVTVTPTSYTLRTYRNGTAEDNVTTLPPGVVIELYAGSSLVSQDVVFDQRGQTPQSPTPPQFYVCNVSCASPTNSNANLVIVTPTGTVNLLSGSGSIPSFGIPTMSNINTTTGVSNTVIVP